SFGHRRRDQTLLAGAYPVSPEESRPVWSALHVPEVPLHAFRERFTDSQGLRQTIHRRKRQSGRVRSKRQRYLQDHRRSSLDTHRAVSEENEFGRAPTIFQCIEGGDVAGRTPTV